jgi:hypothetical protein
MRCTSVLPPENRTSQVKSIDAHKIRTRAIHGDERRHSELTM